MATENRSGFGVDLAADREDCGSVLVIVGGGVRTAGAVLQRSWMLVPRPQLSPPPSSLLPHPLLE